MTHPELVNYATRWLGSSYKSAANYGHGPCGIIITELSAATWGGEIPDAIGFIPGKSILIECKVSIQDFKADKQKIFRKMPDFGMGDYRWFLAPEGVIPEWALPKHWGLIEVKEQEKMQVVRDAEYQVSNKDSEITLLISAMRRIEIIPDKNVAIKTYRRDPHWEKSKNRAELIIEMEAQDER